MTRFVTHLFWLLLLGVSAHAQALKTLFEQTGGSETVTYAQGIQFFKTLTERDPRMQWRTMGPTDAGEPLHLLLMSNDRDFDLAQQRARGKCILLINNGIHPGEPDGVDASLRLLRDLSENTNGPGLPDNVLLAVVPFYNIDGALNRGPYSRVNQNGPREYGFRANARNYDLNRDFVKSDTRNARSFAELFHLLDPDLLVDTHVSNGADYQHVMTLIATQHSKLGGAMGRYLHNVLEPALYRDMEQRGFPMLPYVSNFGPNIASEGLEAFVDLPRYSTGYAALFQTFGFMPETHMLKPYAQRVEATYQLLRTFLNFAGEHATELRAARMRDREAVKNQVSFPLAWQPDTTRFDTVRFRGYRAGYKPSAVSGQPRLFYDRDQPFEQDVRFYNYLTPSQVIKKPKAYLIPQGWYPVLDLLRLNGVAMQPLPADTTLTVEVTRIDDYRATAQPFEGHHVNSGVKSSVRRQAVRFRRGDVLIPTGQATDRYLVELLEPTGPDSFFAWNLFDTILQQKEGFSDYVFEDVAAEWLKTRPDLRAELESRRAADPAFAQSGRAQLEWVYRQSPWYEPEHRRLPVFRVF
jgi:hypothetical protein